MAAYKDKAKNTWYTSFYYENWKGERKRKLKRGFATKKEALEWERNFQQQKSVDLDMTFESFVEIYRKDKEGRLKEYSWQTKSSIIDKKLLPAFGKKKMSEILPSDIIQWQNDLIKGRNGKKYSQTYLRIINAQLSTIFNHAVKYYELKVNPASKVGNMGKSKGGEMLFWTKNEYLKFAAYMQDKPLSFHAFEMLYWCGLRIGELLALTPADFDFTKNTVTINKSYQRIKGKDVITTPKTAKSNRTIKMPDFLNREMQDYIKTLYGVKPTDRILPITKNYLHYEMTRGAKEQGVKRIRIHDLRHSHVSLLIEMGFSALAIADRLGHESINVTYRYAHLFPSKQTEIADKLNSERGDAEVFIK
jgi:integrase